MSFVLDVEVLSVFILGVVLFLETTIFFNTAGVHFFNVFLIFGRGFGLCEEDKLDVAFITSVSPERGVVFSC
jgi:hypothetical protein